MTTKIKAGVIGDNVVGITQLNVSDGSDGQVLTTNGSGTLSFSTVAGTTINNNADNRIITGSGTANTLNGDSNFTYNGTTFALGGTSSNKSVAVESATGNKGFLSAWQDTAMFGINRDPATGTMTQTGRASALVKLESYNADAYITFQTSTTNNAEPTERMRIDSSGNVGIGLTPLYSGNGTARPSLEIGGSTEGSLAFNGTGKAGLIITNSKNISGVFKAAHTGLAGAYGQTAGEHIWYTAASVSAGSNQTFNERMRIDSAGVVHAKAGLGATPITSCSGFTGTAGYKYLIKPVGAVEPFWAVYSGDNYKSRGKGYFRWWYGYGEAATGTNYRRCEVDLVDKNLEFYEVIVEDMAATTYNSSAPVYEWAYWSTRQKFNTQSSNTNYATSSSMSGSIEAMWGQAGGHGLYSSVIGNVCSWGALNANDVIGAGFTGSCGTYPTTLKGVPEPHYTDCSLRLGRPITGSASFTQSTGAFSYWFNF